MSKSKAKTTAERVAKHRADMKGKGWKRREYRVTDEEHEKLTQQLKEFREYADAPNDRCEIFGHMMFLAEGTDVGGMRYCSRCQYAEDPVEWERK